MENAADAHDLFAVTSQRLRRLIPFDAAVWRGRAYQPDAASVRVNAPPAIMSVRAGDRTHYEHWLRERHGDDTKFLDDGLGVTLVPRGVYGDYLEQTATAALARL
ncbi:FAD/NAD(P)-binding protein, partial [Nocardia cyriacigeorgica]|nr:FAD/NAD(P)-binding protein [Nocardia cyriacigeorgica]